MFNSKILRVFFFGIFIVFGCNCDCKSIPSECQEVSSDTSMPEKVSSKRKLSAFEVCVEAGGVPKMGQWLGGLNDCIFPNNK